MPWPGLAARSIVADWTKGVAKNGPLIGYRDAGAPGDTYLKLATIISLSTLVDNDCIMDMARISLGSICQLWPSCRTNNTVGHGLWHKKAAPPCIFGLSCRRTIKGRRRKTKLKKEKF